MEKAEALDRIDQARETGKCDYTSCDVTTGVPPMCGDTLTSDRLLQQTLASVLGRLRP